MKYTALILLCAVALGEARSRGLYPNGCPTNWDIEQLLPHPNCHKFYQCWDGTLVEKICPSDLYFSVEENRCEWSEVVDCTGREIPDQTNESTSTTEQNDSNVEDGSDETSIEDNGSDDNDNDNNNITDGDNDNEDDSSDVNVGAGNCDPSEAPAICASENSDSILVAHKKCNKFYICDNGVPVVQNCPANLFFNPKTDACDYPKNVDCSGKIIPDGEDEDDSTSDSGTDDNDSNDGNSDNGNDSSDGNTGAGNSDPSEAAAICAAEKSDSVLVAHENCNKFYICNNGVPLALRCPANLFFNPKTDACDFPENVDCSGQIIPGGEDDNDNTDDNGTDDNGTDDNGSDSDNGDDSSDVSGGAGNSDPSEAAAICAADNSESVLVAHENCNKFYICNNGVPLALRCPANLFFNPKTDACDFPENVDCSGQIIPGGEDDNDNTEDNGSDTDDNGSDSDNGDDSSDVSGGAGNSDPSEAAAICAADNSESVLVAHENCNKFYICNNGVPLALRCPANLFFNPKTDACDFPENVDCSGQIIPGGEDDNDNTDDNGTDDNGTDDNGSDSDNGDDSSDVSGGAGNSDPSEAAAICAADNSESVLVAHENCNKFYICNNGVPLALRCPANLFFNPKTDACDFPENVDCSGQIIPGGEDDNDNTDDNGTDDNGTDDNGSDSDNGDDSSDVSGGAGNSDPSEAAAICAADNSESVLVAHENCNKFYICNNGVPLALRCPANLFFNPKTDACDFPENVDCSGQIIPGGEDDNNGTDDNGTDNNGTDDNGSDSDNGDDSSDVSGGAGNSDPSEAAAICAADNSESVLVAHENCNKFYICNNGVPLALRCPANLFFNPKTDACDFPENVDCSGQIIPGGEDDNDNTDDNGTDDNGTDDNGSDSDNGDDSSDVSGGAGNSDPSEAAAICAADNSESVLVAHENCNKFYICNNGVPLALRCPANLFFNPKTDACDFPENVDCSGQIIPGGEDDNDNTEDNGSDTDDNGSDSDNGDDSSDVSGGAGNSDPSEAAAICAADNSDSVLVAHENCNKFYICNNGVPLALRCPANLFFNPKTDACDFPENVDCSGQIIPGGEDDNDNTDDNGTDDNGTDDNGSDSDNGDDSSDVSGGAGNSDPSEAAAICAADNSESVLVAHENCNKFYICNNGVPLALRCPANLFFNPKTDACDFPENVDCSGQIIPGGEDDNDNTEDNGSDTDDNGSDSDNGDDSSDVSGGAGNSDPSEAAAICAADNSDSVLVAHENCNKFYICNNGVPLALRCPANLFFNPKTDACDFPENVDCSGQIIPGGEDDNDNTEDNGSDTDDNGSDSDNGDDSSDVSGGAGNSDPSEAAAICAADNSESVLVAHEKCNKFYICANGAPVPVRCPANLFFNPQTDSCDFLENVDCSGKIIPDGEDDNDDGTDNNGTDNNGTDDNGSDSDNGDDSSDVSGGAGNSDPSEAAAICAADNSDSVLVAHENCNKFYICNNGVPLALRCPANLFFNPKTDACDFPENVDCSGQIIPGGEDDNDNTDDNGTDDNDNNDGESDNGDDSGDVNVGAGNSDPSEAAAICAAENSDSVLVAHEKCNKFYICANGVPLAQRCPASLFFNPGTDTCDFLENVDCSGKIIPDGEDSTNDNGTDDNETEDGDSNDNDSVPEVEDNNGGDSEDQVSEIPDKEEDNNDNGDDSDANTDGNGNVPVDGTDVCPEHGVYKPHLNCNQFYICLEGRLVSLTCPGNLLYDVEDHVCVWPEEVDCGNRAIPSRGF